jgi:hypothetical protein
MHSVKYTGRDTRCKAWTAEELNLRLNLLDLQEQIAVNRLAAAMLSTNARADT